MAGHNYSCPADVLASFDKNMEERTWRVDALLVASAILAGLIVGIGAYGQRYRHHRFTRSIFLGATTLLLPITSTVVSLATGSDDYIKQYQFGVVLLIADCKQSTFAFLVVIWASLVQTIMINTSAVVVVDDREGRNIGPPFELLVQGAWTAYLVISYITVVLLLDPSDVVFGFTPFALNCAKTIFKWYAFEKARQSFALGRNPRLIFGYMQQPQLQETIQHGEPIVAEDAPPPLLVMGEERRDVDKHPHGFVFKEDLAGTMLQKNNGCVTIDRVWKLDSMLPMSKPQRLKDLCLSFALFKLLRCRFARYELVTAISKDTFNFFWSLLLKDGGHDRVFGVIADELSFLHDYYYSSLPISYSKCWLPVVGFFISLLSVAYCIWVAVHLTYLVIDHGDIDIKIYCEIRCIKNQLQVGNPDTKTYRYFDLVPVLLFFVLVVIAEVRDMASYICSNWTKVALICRLLNRASSQHSLCIQKWIGLLLRCRCKMMKHWDETMGQCSVLVLHPRTTPLVLLRRLLRLPDQKRKVKVSSAVKVCIIGALRGSRNGHRSNGKASLRRQSQVGESFLWACNSKSTSDIILTWHVATSILEVRHPYQHHQEQQGSPSISDCKIAASHLSRYCAYLVTWCPELLPDDDAWSKSLYEDVKKDAERVLAGRAAAGSSSTPEAKYQQLIELLSADAEHQVLKNGVRLGKQLVETTSGGEEETTWKLLAGFWSEMILYVAPSDNLKGHKEVIARGGELITLLWALLFHAGIVSRPGEDDDGAAATSAGVV